MINSIAIIRNMGDQWTREKTMHLIEVYRSRECLWKISCPQYSDRNLKQDAWEEISKIVGCDVRSAEKKMKTVKTQFMNYYKHAKIGDSYSKPKWFAYSALQFLLQNRIIRRKRGPFFGRNLQDRNIQPLQSENAITLSSRITTIHQTEDNQQLDTPDELPSRNTPVMQRKSLALPKSKSVTNGQLESLRMPLLDASSHFKDRLDMYGLHIADRLRNLNDKYLLAVGTNRIDNVLFELEMTAYGEDHTRRATTGSHGGQQSVDTLEVSSADDQASPSSDMP